MTVKEKSKKSLIRRILKWTGISFLILIVAMIVVPIIFKDDIKELVIKEANKSLLADFSLGEFDLTFISTFPNLTITLTDTKIAGRGEFKGVNLVSIKEFSAQVGLWSVIGGDAIEIDEIHLNQPTFDVRILSNGKANYDIVKPDSVKTPEEKADTSNFKLSLKEYSINNAHIRYDDQVGDMFTELINFTHLGQGDLTADVIDFKTKTTMDETTFEMGGVSYLKKVKTEMIANILMEFTEKTSKFTLKDNELSLNALHFSFDGFYEMLEGYDNMDLKLKADKATFKDFLSLIPTFYQSGYESMIANGDLAFNGEVKGRMDDVNMPGWNFGLSVGNAKIKYAGLPGSIDNISVKAGSTFVGGSDLDKMTLDVPKFHASFVGNTIDMTLKMRTPMSDPLIDSKIIAKVDLSTLGKVIPMGEGESYNGKLVADIVLKGKVSALENENYEAFKADGTLLISDMIYKSKDLPGDVAVKEMLLRFSPQNLSLESLDAKMGKSDFQMDGKIDNYLGYVFRNELLKGDFSFKSNNLDLDELMASSTPTNEPVAASSDATTTTTATASTEPFLIPGNVDFNLTTSITNLRYNKMDIKNIKGGIKLKEEVASLDNLTMNAMGGTIGLKGDYSTKEHTKPTIDFGYNLNGIDISELVDNFVTIEKMAPIAKSAKGKISSTFEMKSVLTANMEPVYSSLNGKGDFFTNSVIISGYKPLDKIAEVTKMSKLATQTLKDLKVNFKFQDGKITLTPFTIKLGNIPATISGSTSFEQDIDYSIKMMVPKEEIPAGILKGIEDQVQKLGGIAGKIDLSKVIPDNIPVNVKVIGKATDPKVTTDLMESLKSAANLKGTIKNAVKDVVNKAKDSVKVIVTKKVEEIREDLNAKKQKLIDDAQNQVNILKVLAKKEADLVRSEGDNGSKVLMNEAGGNPIKKKLAEVAGAKLKKTADDKATKIETEAETKADAIMNAARDKANQIK